MCLSVYYLDCWLSLLIVCCLPLWPRLLTGNPLCLPPALTHCSASDYESALSTLPSIPLLDICLFDLLFALSGSTLASDQSFVTFVLLRCFSCSHTVLPKEHSLGVISPHFPHVNAVFFFNSTCISLPALPAFQPWTLNLEYSGTVPSPALCQWDTVRDGAPGLLAWTLHDPGPMRSILSLEARGPLQHAIHVEPPGRNHPRAGLSGLWPGGPAVTPWRGG